MSAESEPKVKEKRPEITELIKILERYNAVYDLLDQDWQERWDEAETEALASLGDPTVDAKKAEENLRDFIKVLEEKTKEEAN
jgi:hypothetical protein